MVLKGHYGPITGVCALHGDCVASCSSDNTLRVWQPSSGECLRVIGLEASYWDIQAVNRQSVIGGRMGTTTGVLAVWNLASHSEVFCATPGSLRARRLASTLPATCTLRQAHMGASDCHAAPWGACNTYVDMNLLSCVQVMRGSQRLVAVGLLSGALQFFEIVGEEAEAAAARPGATGSLLPGGEWEVAAAAGEGAGVLEGMAAMSEGQLVAALKSVEPCEVLSACSALWARGHCVRDLTRCITGLVEVLSAHAGDARICCQASGALYDILLGSMALRSAAIDHGAPQHLAEALRRHGSLWTRNCLRLLDCLDDGSMPWALVPGMAGLDGHEMVLAAESGKSLHFKRAQYMEFAEVSSSLSVLPTRLLLSIDAYGAIFSLSGTELCLDSYGGPAQVGRGYVIHPRHGGVNQRWLLEEVAERQGFFYIRSAQKPEIVWDLNGTVLEQRLFSSARATQQWRLTLTPGRASLGLYLPSLAELPQRGVRAMCCLEDGLLVTSSGAALLLWRELRPWGGQALEPTPLAASDPCVGLAPLTATTFAAVYGDVARVWDVSSLLCVAQLRGKPGSARCCVGMAGGSYLACGSLEGAVRVWHVPTGTLTSTLLGHAGAVEALCPLPDGRLSSCSADGTARLWDVRQRTCLLTLEHGNKVTSLAYVPLGSSGILASGCSDGVVRLWDVQEGKVLERLTSNVWSPKPVLALAALPNGVLAATGAGFAVQLWDLVNGKCRGSCVGHTSWAVALANMPCGRLASSAEGASGEIRVWGASKVTGASSLALLAATAHGTTLGKVLPGFLPVRFLVGAGLLPASCDFICTCCSAAARRPSAASHDLGFMRGLWMGGTGCFPILAVHALKTGEQVYLAQEGEHTKMARGSGEPGRYYTGKVEDFRAVHWDLYAAVPPGAYVYIPPTK